MSARLNYRTIRIDKRYSAACEARWMRKARRYGARISNADIRRHIIAAYGW